MRKVTLLIAPLMLLWSVVSAQAAAIQISSLSGNDFIEWSAQPIFTNPEGTNVPSPQSFTTSLTRTGTVTNTGDFAPYTEGSLLVGNFGLGENALYSTTQSFSINFDTLVAGVGTQIISNAYGAFTATIELFDGANVSIGGPFAVSGVTDGFEDDSAPFLGALSDSVNIARALLTITANTSDFGLLINRVELTDTPARVDPVPEPATLTLLGLGGAASAIARRRRARKA